MSSVGTVRAGVVDAFRNADNGTVTRTLVVKVDVGTEEIYSVADGRASVSLQRDYSQVQTLADMHGPCWLLVKHPGANQWRIYTYCSDNENVKTKMLYSAAKDTLLKSLGAEKFAVDMHASTTDELSFKNIEDAGKPAGDSALSPWELEHKKIISAEQQEARTRSESNSGVGGYHAVQIPLDSSAERLIGELKSGSASFIELKVNESKNAIVGVTSKSGVTTSNASSHLSKSEPRFYVIKGDAARYFFLYMCPESSPVSSRMVYSTAKPAVLDGIKRHGVTIAESAESSDPSDVNSSLWVREKSGRAYSAGYSGSPNRSQEPDWLKHRSAVVGRNSPSSSSGSSSPLGEQSKSKNSNVMQGAHPTAQLMAGSSPSNSSTKKKIVVPPPGAW
jgi:hypothetical protein